MIKKKPTDSSTLRCEKISTLPQLFKLLEQPSILSECDLFDKVEWIKCWSNIYWQPTWSLNVYVFYDDDRLVGYAPFYIKTANRWFDLNILSPLGQGEPEASEIATEYTDIIIYPGYESTILAKLSIEIKNLSLDKIEWRAVIDNSNIKKLVTNLFCVTLPPNHNRYIVQRLNWSLKALSKNTRKRYSRSKNQLIKINAKFSLIKTEDFEKSISILESYHQQRWHNKGLSGAFAHKEFIQFHQIFRQKHANKKIKITAITINDHPIALNYYFVDNNTWYFYQSGWDEINYSNFSLGQTLHLWSIEQCEEKYYDFMMGSFNDSYKEKFGCMKQPMLNIDLTIKRWKVFLNKLATFNK